MRYPNGYMKGVFSTEQGLRREKGFKRILGGYMKRSKPQVYELHDSVYRDLRSKNLHHWLDKLNRVPPPGKDGIDLHDERFLCDVLAQDWAPKRGAAIELGCGTGPLLRWLSRRGFKGLGVDVSCTAVRMAREQSAHCRGLRFRRADVIRDSLGPLHGYDLALDGHWLHCITQPNDRRRALSKVRSLLRKRGVFIVLSMCAPVLAKRFREIYPEQLLKNHIVYQSFDAAERYKGSLKLRGRAYAPLRYVGHWKSILREVRSAGFEPRLLRLNHAYADEVVGSLCVAAIAV